MASTNEEMVLLLRSQGFASPAVADAMLKVDRKLFVSPDSEQFAYSDYPMPIGFGQTISAPGIVAIMSNELDVRKGMKVLEVGTGSGYQAAILAELVGKTGKVISIERIPGANELAKTNLGKIGYANIELIIGDGSKGYPKEAPFDRIIVTAASPTIPKALPWQLKDGGKLIAPIGSPFGQELVMVQRKGKEFTEEKLLPVAFVPLIGEHGFEERKV